jgi:hypothetical protein
VPFSRLKIGESVSQIFGLDIGEYSALSRQMNDYRSIGDIRKLISGSLCNSKGPIISIALSFHGKSLNIFSISIIRLFYGNNQSIPGDLERAERFSL